MVTQNFEYFTISNFLQTSIIFETAKFFLRKFGFVLGLNLSRALASLRVVDRSKLQACEVSKMMLVCKKFAELDIFR